MNITEMEKKRIKEPHQKYQRKNEKKDTSRNTKET